VPAGRLLTMNGDSLRLLGEMRSSLDRLLLVVRSMQDTWRGDYATPSSARAEWTSCTEPFAFDLEETYYTAMVQWHAIQDLTRGLVGTIDLTAPFCSISVARSLAENAARSWYLLEAGITPLERVRRCFNDRLYANFEDERLLRGLLARDDMAPELLAVAQQAEPVVLARLDHVRQVRNGLVTSAQRYGFQPTNTTRADKLSIVGEGRPSDQKVIGLATGQPTQLGRHPWIAARHDPHVRDRHRPRAPPISSAANAPGRPRRGGLARRRNTHDLGADLVLAGRMESWAARSRRPSRTRCVGPTTG
jgi:hypothetical protein